MRHGFHSALATCLAVATFSTPLVAGPLPVPPGRSRAPSGVLPGNVHITGNTFAAATRTTDAGPFTYTISLENTATSAKMVEMLCSDQSQLRCVEPSPSEWSMPANSTQDVTVGYTTRGVGRYQQKHVLLVQGVRKDSLTVQWITVEGLPMQTHVSPIEGQTIGSTDSLKVVFQHPSGLVQNSFRIFLDGHDSTSSIRDTITSTSVRWMRPTLVAGNHSFTSYGCAQSGRCDSLTTTFLATGPGSVWELDDSLPPVEGGGRFGLLPGALPLPPANLRGCPVNAGDPEMLVGPFSYIYQWPNASDSGGYIFMAALLWDATIQITATTVDYPPSSTRTCATIPWLDDSQYDWNYWAHSDPNDPLWDSYPYGDRTGYRMQSVVTAPRSGHAPDKAGLGPDHATGRAWGQSHGGGGIIPMIRNPGGINPSTYWVTLNGDTIVKNGAPVAGKGVTLVQIGLTGSTFSIQSSNTRVNHYHPDYPTNPDSSPNGGWNEVIASIADSAGNRTSIRERFVVPKQGSVGDIAVTALRDFRHLAQGECAAFGPFQCAGITLAHPIPGFTSRDRDRSLHLVYRSASQHALTILPFQVDIPRMQLAPDSLLTFVTVNGSNQPDSLRNRYAGKSGGGAGDQLLDEYADESRIVGGSVQPATSNVDLVSAAFTVRGFYPGTTRDNTLTQDVARVYWTDTASTRVGAGWNLAEQARLLFVTPQSGAAAAIYATGDGSYTVFRQVGGVWVAPPGETARLIAQSDASDTTAYMLHFGDGTALGFQSDGRQTHARDLLGNKTSYEWGGGKRLTAIADPSGFRYEFSYSGASVSEVRARYQGSTSYLLASLAYDGSGRLTSVRNWRDDSHADTTRFGYLAGAPGAFLDSVTDARGQVTKFGYETRYYTPVALIRPPLSNVRDTAQFRDVWRRALPRVGRGRLTDANAERLVYVSQLNGTYVPFAGYPTDYRADRFGAPTWVRHISPGYPVDPLGGDDVRDIERDSTGHVVKIVAARASPDASDSVMYEYDASYNVVRIIQPTAQWPVGSAALDTVRFSYDSVTSGLLFTNQRCTRLRARYDVLGVRADTVTYGASGAGQCLPVQVKGNAGDSTRFAYGTLQSGVTSTTRPTSVTDPVGAVQSVSYASNAWNTATVTRQADNAVTTVTHDALGRPDSVVSPMGVPTVTRHDRLGRVYLQRTGSTAGAPVAATYFGTGGLMDSVRVYGTTGAVDASPTTAVQRTRYFYNTLGWLDSTLSPGGRVQAYLRDRLGNPHVESPGNGSFIARVFDWQNRLTNEYLSPVYPGYSVDGRAFATSQTDSVYRSFNLDPTRTTSAGGSHLTLYDIRGRVAWRNDSVVTWEPSYNRRGALVSDRETFADGAFVNRTYRYNRRGQRTLVTDSVVRTSTGALIGRGRTVSVWDSTTGRLDTLRAYRYTGGSDTLIARIWWAYDVAGRDTLRSLLLGGSSHELQRRTQFDAVGHVARQIDSSAAGAWYWFSNTTYRKSGDLVAFHTSEPAASGGPGSNQLNFYTMVYDSVSPGTGRILQSSRLNYLGQAQTDYTWRYDVFGNRRFNWCQSAASVCSDLDTVTFGGDNQLAWHFNSGTSVSGAYWHDAAGNRLARTDSTNHFYDRAGEILSYTAKGQLFFAYSPTASLGTADYVWHWYDGTGLRVMTATKQGVQLVPSGPAVQDSTDRTYYVYDGADVALVLFKQHSTGNWLVQQRLVTVGVDQPVAGSYYNNAVTSSQNLALINDYQGSVRAAVKANDSRENYLATFGRNAFGGLEGASGTGGGGSETNAQAGYTGASTPTATGGFTYMRNRWYDPATGRFLTQDPIGLAGGVNLYSYAGNNPVAYSDPFGLCGLPGEPQCRIYISAYGAAAGASLGALKPESRDALQAVANTSGHDLGVNATTNGDHRDPRHNGFSFGFPENNNPALSGLAVDIGEIDRTLVRRASAQVQGEVRDAALSIPEVRSVLSPSGLFRTGTYGRDAHPYTDTNVQQQHKGHFHLSFFSNSEMGLPQ